MVLAFASLMVMDAFATHKSPQPSAPVKAKTVCGLIFIIIMFWHEVNFDQRIKPNHCYLEIV